MRVLLGILLLALGACAVQLSNYQISDVLLYGIQERHTIFYGKLEAGQTRAVQLDSSSVTLSGNVPLGALAIPNALTVNGAATLPSRPKAIREVMSVATIPLTTDLSVLTRDQIKALIYFDGRKWFDVGSRDDIEKDVKLRLNLRERNTGLRGIGELSNTEADALQGYLQDKKQALVIGLLEYPNIPDSYLNLSPRPDKVNLTALYVQVGLPVDLLGGFTNTEPLTVRALTNGSNSTHNSPSPLLRWDTSASSFNNTWQLIAGNQVPLPSAPSLDFSRSSTISFFMGQKPSGGYGLALATTRVENGVLQLRFNLSEPAPGRPVTLAITSPFVAVQISGGSRFQRVQAINNSTGSVLAQLEQSSR